MGRDARFPGALVEAHAAGPLKPRAQSPEKGHSGFHREPLPVFKTAATLRLWGRGLLATPPTQTPPRI